MTESLLHVIPLDYRLFAQFPPESHRLTSGPQTYVLHTHTHTRQNGQNHLVVWTVCAKFCCFPSSLHSILAVCNGNIYIWFRFRRLQLIADFFFSSAITLHEITRERTKTTTQNINYNLSTLTLCSVRWYLILVTLFNLFQKKLMQPTKEHTVLLIFHWSFNILSRFRI